MDETSELEAVWSFWSPPFAQFHRGRWLDDEFHMLSWVLSVTTVYRHFPKCVLVTDSPGAKLLVDQLQLPFSEVSTSLDRLDPSLRGWWVLGKLRAFQERGQPFIHFDSDVYLWKQLPTDLRRADVLMQNPEPAPVDDMTYYKPTRIARAFDRNGGSLPGFVTSYMESGGGVAFCMGIFGGSALPVIHRYATEAEHLVCNPANAAAWRELNDPLAHSVFVEQYLLAALLSEERRERNRSLNLAHLFASQADAFLDEVAKRAGYTHLIGEAKRRPDLKRLLVERVRAIDPKRFEIISRLQAEVPGSRSRTRPPSSDYVTSSSRGGSFHLVGGYGSAGFYGGLWSQGIGASLLASQFEPRSDRSYSGRRTVPE
jgi:hypothetical protein